MRTSNWKFMTMALAASMTLFTACTDNNEPGNGDGVEDNKYELTKDIESDTELEAGKTYTLSGGIHVKNGATLKIPAGVTIIAKHDDVVDYILIQDGANIDAQGTDDFRKESSGRMGRYPHLRIRTHQCRRRNR